MKKVKNTEKMKKIIFFHIWIFEYEKWKYEELKYGKLKYENEGCKQYLTRIKLYMTFLFQNIEWSYCLFILLHQYFTQLNIKFAIIVILILIFIFILIFLFIFISILWQYSYSYFYLFLYLEFKYLSHFMHIIYT